MSKWMILCLTGVCLMTCMVGGLSAAEVHLVEEPVVAHQRLEDGTILLDFGKVAFGNLKVNVPDGGAGPLKFHFGEAMKDGRVDRKPPGSVRYGMMELQADGKNGWQVQDAPTNGWNSRPGKTVLTPKEWGVVLPFRWIEIEGWKGDFDPKSVVRQSGYLKAWDEGAAHFECSDPVLNRIWDLCKYSIKATTFAGIYVDGDRERIPYEADAYLNQLSHYYCDADKQIARDTYDWLMEKPTWPTEWAPHMVFMAHADWMFTGDVSWLTPRYEALKSKLLMDRVGDDGWVKSDEKARSQVKGYYGERDIVDWPRGERDGYVFTEVNTVVNAFHLRAVEQMADIAQALGKDAEAAEYRKRAQDGVKRFHEALWIAGKGAYRDGIGTDHTSAHATFFPLAFGLVPDDCRDQAVAFLKTRGMACSVYAAQYLMESLFENGAEDYALELMTADNDRSWKHMVESGTTITWEAWDQKYKPNQDWNHAWGAAPGNLLPRYVLGVEPAEAGWKKVRIEPIVGNLTSAKGKVPTPYGPVEVEWHGDDRFFTIAFKLPEGVTAAVSLPAKEGLQLVGSGKLKESSRHGERILLKEIGPGSHQFQLRAAE